MGPPFPPLPPDRKGLRGTGPWEAGPGSRAAPGARAMDVRRLKVNELREELQRRGLDTRGLNAELTERLQEALEAEEPVDEQEIEADDEPGRPGHNNEEMSWTILPCRTNSMRCRSSRKRTSQATRGERWKWTYRPVEVKTEMRQEAPTSFLLPEASQLKPDRQQF